MAASKAKSDECGDEADLDAGRLPISNGCGPTSPPIPFERRSRLGRFVSSEQARIASATTSGAMIRSFNPDNTRRRVHRKRCF